jgi:excisionase family DNA binding protein
MSDSLDLNDLISQAEAAELRNVTRASINELVKRGRLRTVQIGGKAFLYRSEVLNFEPDKGGRPPKTKAEGNSKGSKKGGKK